MEKLRENHGAPTVERALRHLSIRLKASEETAGFAAAIDTARAAFTQADEAYKQALEERIAASAEIEYLDGRLDGAVAGLAREVFAFVGGDRADARYQRLFPTTPSAALRGTGDDTQARFVRHVVETLRQDPELEPLKAHAETLTQAQERIDAAIAAREQKYLPESQALTNRRIALEKARRVYNVAYPQLLAALQDETRVESFFLKLRQAADPPAPVDA